MTRKNNKKKNKTSNRTNYSNNKGGIQNQISNIPRSTVPVNQTQTMQSEVTEPAPLELSVEAIQPVVPHEKQEFENLETTPMHTENSSNYDLATSESTDEEKEGRMIDKIFSKKSPKNPDLKPVLDEIEKLQQLIVDGEKEITETFQKNLANIYSKLLKYDNAKVVEDIKNSVELLSKSIKSNEHLQSDFNGQAQKFFQEIKHKLAALDQVENKLNRVSQRNDVHQLGDKVTDKLDGIQNATSKEIRSLKREVEEVTQKIDVEFELKKKLRGIEKNTEMVLGKVESFQQQDNEELKRLLEDKTIMLKKEFPAMNEDEETIIELAKYGEYIVEQLTTAARHYARKRKDLENIAEERNKHGQEIIRVREEAEKAGVDKGRKELVTALLSSYSNVHNLFTSDVPEVQILSTFLKNNQVVPSPLTVQGEVVEVTDQNRQEIEIYASFTGLGKFTIEQPAYLVDNEVYQRAIFKAYTEPAIVIEETPVEIKKEESAASQEEVEVAREESTAPQEEVEAAQEEPAASLEEVEVVQEEPAALQEEVEVAQEEPVAPQEEVEVAQEEPAAPQEEVEVAQEEPATLQEEMEPAQEEITTVPQAEVEPAQAQASTVLQVTELTTEPVKQEQKAVMSTKK